MQGGHQVAQKLMNTTLPFNELKDTVFPSLSLNITSLPVWSGNDVVAFCAISVDAVCAAFLFVLLLQAAKQKPAIITKMYVKITLLFNSIFISLFFL